MHHADAHLSKPNVHASSRTLNESRLNELAPLKDFSHSPVQDQPGTFPAAPNGGAPSQASPDSAESTQSFVCREHILDDAGRMAGYEFMLRKPIKHNSIHETPAVMRLYDEVLLRNVIEMGVSRLPEQRMVFIGICPTTINSRLLGMLPSGNIALVIRNSTVLAGKQAEFYSALRALQEAGYRIALEDFQVTPEMVPFLEVSSFVAVDVSSSDSQQLNRLVEFFSRNYPDVKLIAKNVESMEAYEFCRKSHFHYFQGAFLTRLDVVDQSEVCANQIRLFELLNLVQKDADTSDLVAEFKLDPMLTYKLLRYINSPGCGLLMKVTSIEHALTVLGQKKLYRWLTLFLFSCGMVNARDWALMESALVRGRLTEMLGREVFQPAEYDNLFIVGFFSLLDVLLRMPMGKALAQLNLGEDLAQALIYRQGKYAPYLELAIACEQFNQEKIAALANECQLDVRKVNLAQIDAMVWSLEIDK